MELFTIIFGVLIFAETSILLVRSMNTGKKSILGGNKRKVYIDSSALMDARILEVAKTGFIADDMIIPRSVIREMQLVADGKDSEKRARARVGMDVVSELERIPHFDITILEDDLNHTPVDERLIELAKKNHGAIMTCDFNLEKVAKTEHIAVLNVNELTLALRSEFLPGEKFSVRLTEKGANPGQGVGFLPNGMMVVVNNATNKIGETIEVEFVRLLQTSAGRMIFATPVNQKKQGNNKRR